MAADIKELMGKTDTNSLEMQKLIGEVLRGQSNNEKKTKVERFKRLNEFVRPGQILFAGSSLAEQFPINELCMDLELPYTIYNRGIGGYTTPELLKVMDVCVYDLKPAYIFMNIGTNDMNDAEFDLDEFIARYEAILCGIKENLPEAKVWLLSYYPVNPSIGSNIPYMAYMLKNRTNARIAQANAAVKELAGKMGMEYLDVNTGLTDENGNLKAEYTIEGMHMYANGYKVVLENLLPTLATLN